MRNFITISILVFLIGTLGVSGQRAIEFVPVYGFQTFQLDKYFPINKSDSVKIENVRFYISKIQFLKSDAVVFSEEDSYHLIDLSKPNSLRITNLPDDIHFTHLSFNLGIDSVTNVSGAMGGDLDPTWGMYWTWQSGYINVKVEGKSNLCNTRLNEFSLHLGGYTSPYLAVQHVELVVKNPNKIKVYFDLYAFLTGADLSVQNQIMSPGAAAVALSDKFSRIFTYREK